MPVDRRTATARRVLHGARRAVALRARSRRRTGPLVLITLAVAIVHTASSANAATAWRVALGASNAQAQAQQLSAPTSVTATCTNPTLSKTITVSWAAVSHATYTVFQSSTSASSGYTAVASGLTTTSWTSGALSSNKTYWYEVAAVIGANWTSPNSTATTGRTIRNTTPFCQ